MICHNLPIQWLPTLVALGGGDVSGSALPLDGVDQWPTISLGTPTTRKFIIHNVPITATPVDLPPGPGGKGGGWSTSTCLSSVDNRTGGCHGFGLTGGAIRVGDFKLLVSHPTRAPWEDSSPAGTGQGTPGGRYPNRTNVFTPAIATTVPAPWGNVFDPHLRRNITVYLFNIKEDPTESVNLANTSTAKLAELLNFYNAYAAKPDTVMGLSWRYGFQDKNSGTVPIPTPSDPTGTRCTGAFDANGGSQYCHFGREWECYVSGRAPAAGPPLKEAAGAGTTSECQSACAAVKACEWWVLKNETASDREAQTAGSTATPVCELYGASTGAVDCAGCEMGPKACPGMGGVPEKRTMSPATVTALLAATPETQPGMPYWALAGEEDALEKLGRLDAEGYFNRMQL